MFGGFDDREGGGGFQGHNYYFSLITFIDLREPRSFGQAQCLNLIFKQVIHLHMQTALQQRGFLIQFQSFYFNGMECALLVQGIPFADLISFVSNFTGFVSQSDCAD